ncbi:hypothetical protein P170DRAFT_75335 [Aspergillus steynii IBT 23096]|uniref:Uncharacterized protein n=1 Tax=Aspergillus steynii IBT 23096 TaxID=1392250 RepID=A0A2I2FRN1_9EURO|nr:uncharacterized protein P170DRAFT_75335 [Aspergillus steynii IBT 23096]PLB43298.1 hypothetical protein P170DRAFT_75335 [Aspergillus steynii IBT 23096]
MDGPRLSTPESASGLAVCGGTHYAAYACCITPCPPHRGLLGFDFGFGLFGRSIEVCWSCATAFAQDLKIGFNFCHSTTREMINLNLWMALTTALDNYFRVVYFTLSRLLLLPTA